MASTPLHTVAVLVLEGAKPLDVGIPAQVFTTRASMPYEVRVCGAAPGLVTGGDGLSYHVPRSVPEPLGERFAETREWALHRLGGSLTLDVLARHAGVSARTFSRRFVEDTGYTPMQWVMRARIDLARELLERSERGVEQIADDVGLGTGADLRLHFRRIPGTTPSDYRRTFTKGVRGSPVLPPHTRGSPRPPGNGNSACDRPASCASRPTAIRGQVRGAAVLFLITKRVGTRSVPGRESSRLRI